MPENEPFSDLMLRVRRGEASAAEELVRRYETQLRVIVKVRMRDPRLRRVLETMDMCQSVLANFFFRASAGQFDLDSPDQLVKLLGQMVRNKVTDHARRATSDRRDVGRLDGADAGDHALAAGHTPSQIVAAEELASRFQRELTEQERQIMRLRQQGRSWDEIAAQFGSTAEAHRKAFSRAIDQAAQRAGLVECSE